MGLRISETAVMVFWFPVACSLVFWMPLLLTTVVAQSTSDGNLLLRIKVSLGGGDDNLLLSTWNTTIPLCQWRGIQWAEQDGTLLNCSASSLVSTNLTLYKDPSIFAHSIQLPAAGLTGTIPKEIAKLSNLQKLYLGVNMLKGPIPLELGNSLSLASVSLSQNQLNGTIPPSIWNLCSQLMELDLDHNGLAGSIPDPALPNVTCPNLQKLDLSYNQLDGPVPTFLSNFTGLHVLDLSNNSLSGTIPDALANLSLTALNLAYNNLSGPIPMFAQNFSQDAFVGNSPSLCGNPLQSCAGGQPSGSQQGHHSRLSPGAVAGIVIALMAAMVVAVSVLIALGTTHDRKIKGEILNEFEEEESGEGRLVLFEGGEHLTVDDVLNATGQVLSKTSYATLYKAKLTQGGTIVLRLLREGTCKELQSFLPAINDLGRLRHENLVPLRAFYEGQRGEKLLAYDYIPKGSLADALHGAGRQHLNWARRHKIALGAARGLAHLHTGLETPIIHGNLKSKNVLVDDYHVAHLTDYGLDRLMSPSAAAEMMAAASLEGYKAPELQKMKKANTKTDIYNFGILLLEILMGKRPGRNSSGSDEIVDLPSIVKAAVLEERTTQVFDAEILRGMRTPADDGLLQALRLAMGCCAPSPSVRPDIKEVIRQLEEIRPKMHSPLYTPRTPRGSIPD
uniref:Protein kinase domain-containing protein n=1 Tax=Araucaria cunninghamii TaxID=56994 RepID=A0A0D6R672_ARACU